MRKRTTTSIAMNPRLRRWQRLLVAHCQSMTTSIVLIATIVLLTASVAAGVARIGPTREASVVHVVQTGLSESFRERARFSQEPALVIGTVRGQVSHTDRNRIWFGHVRAYITASASYEAKYGYRLDTLDKTYRVIMQGDTLVVLIRQPEVLYDANVPTHEIRVTAKSRGTVLLCGRDRQRSIERAKRPLTRHATAEAQTRVAKSQEARRIAEHTVRDVLMTFLADAHPSLARRYHNRIEIRFVDTPWLG